MKVYNLFAFVAAGCTFISCNAKYKMQKKKVVGTVKKFRGEMEMVENSLISKNRSGRVEETILCCDTRVDMIDLVVLIHMA